MAGKKINICQVAYWDNYNLNIKDRETEDLANAMSDLNVWNKII